MKKFLIKDAKKIDEKNKKTLNFNVFVFNKTNLNENEGARLSKKRVSNKFKHERY